MHSYSSKAKKFILILSLSSFISSLFMAGTAVVLLVTDGPLSVITNPVAGIKISMAAAFAHCLLTALLFVFYGPESFEEKFHFQITNIIKCCGILLFACIVFHAIAVCFGAPVLTSVAETFHFSMLMTVLVCLPGCLFFGPKISNWLDVFAFDAAVGIETIVYMTTIGSLLGSWLGAIPIPLDWDRPWQEWPVTCVVGALGGYSGGLLFAAIQLPRKLRSSSKSKFF
ncbi:phosphatidylinositol-glycan biosynthesis class F protein-like [Physella acuta]|uniref:phosphatidylinositol-glycan biosynthesis class F protein-like n=1 Tax=Physella acuta TaxID=109671 RepID=UPI0027DE1286|nr:phosphatidylinositol-glycan biosynthesis class F protein-like [Physella acuta]XP_059174327.1 phosphatidylinositol-glycan biosynthesis class F protein-like [Physella acuta]XP_059174328.1 phosphatidylinositol-glycan biosynthesis class F protein-like [Physella acuta]XP_059174329.1 phosphatidylinositol-glycan biosynthesis class F protein-like [Physella acuta]